jgi:hypothetical protein
VRRALAGRLRVRLRLARADRGEAGGGAEVAERVDQQREGRREELHQLAVRGKAKVSAAALPAVMRAFARTSCSRGISLAT